MANKVWFLKFGLLCVALTLVVAPVKSWSEPTKQGPGQPMKRFKTILSLMNYTVGLPTELEDKLIETFNAVLRDPQVLAIESDEMTSYKKELQDYIQKVKGSKQDSYHEKTLALFFDIKFIVDKFDVEQHRELTHAAVVIGNSFKQNAFDVLQSFILVHFEEFLKKFIADTEQYRASLNVEQTEKTTKFAEWLNQLKAEKDVLKQMELLDEIGEASENEPFEPIAF